MGWGNGQSFLGYFSHSQRLNLFLCLLQAGIASKGRRANWKWHGFEYHAVSDAL